MDDQRHDLEKELAALRPARASALLRARVEQALSRDPAARVPAARARAYATATTLRGWKWAGWPTVAAAAGIMMAVAAGFWLGQQSPGTELPTASAPAGPGVGAPYAGATAPGDVGRDLYLPVAASSILYESRDEGTVELGADQPARRERHRYLDSYVWRNPATNASLRISVPRDEVRVLPVDYH